MSHQVRIKHSYCSICGKAINSNYACVSEHTGEFICRRCKQKEVENNEVCIERYNEYE